MLIYLEACIAGSMVEGGLSDDDGIYVMGASDAHTPAFFGPIDFKLLAETTSLFSSDIMKGKHHRFNTITLLHEILLPTLVPKVVKKFSLYIYAPNLHCLGAKLLHSSFEPN